MKMRRRSPRRSSFVSDPAPKFWNQLSVAVNRKEQVLVVNAVEASPCTVSVIVPTRDRVQWLGEALVSIAAVAERIGQRATIATIVVDDGTDPATEQQATSFGARYLRNDGHGVSAARNTGLRAATGEFVAFLDDDDVWTEHQLTVQLDRFDADPTLGAVFGQCVETDGELRPIGDPCPAEPLPDGDAVTFFAERVIQVGMLLVRRSAAMAASTFDETLASSEDWDWTLRLASTCRVAGVPVTVCQIRRHRDPGDMDLDAWWVRRRHDDVAIKRIYRHVRSRLPLANRVLWQLGAHKVNGADTAEALSWALSCQERGIADRAAEWVAAAWHISPLHTVRLVAQHRALLPIVAGAVRGSFALTPRAPGA
jgi:glycosyltransferase involved in cell wall biosynthesis